MNVKEIKELVDLVAKKGLASLELEHAGFRLRIEGPRADAGLPIREIPARSSPHAAVPSAPPHVAAHEVAAGAPVLAVAAAGSAERAAAPVDEPGTEVVTSPIVGTFYRSPSPEAEPFAKVGDAVEKGQTLCIVEAMKLMNEIESDVAGTVLEVFPQNGQPVEYGERLFRIKVR